MDPTANLQRMLNLARKIIRRADREALNKTDSEDAVFLAELLQGMDQWLNKGGHLPDRWTQCREMKDYNCLLRKVAHGCYDASCSICDPEPGA